MPLIAARKQKILLDRETICRNLPLWSACGLGIMTLATLLLIFGGEPLRPIRQALHIDWIVGSPRGVYVDCRHLKNGLNRFCKKDYENQFNRNPVAPSQFERPSRDLPFSLTDSD